MEPKYVRIPMFLYIPTSIRSLIFHGTGCNQHSVEFPLMGLNCVCHVVYDILLFLPSGQKMLEMLPAPKRDCLKLSVMKFRNCFRQSPRWLTRESLWNSELDSHANSHKGFWSAFLVFRKMRFRSESATMFIQNTLGKGPVFGRVGLCNPEYYPGVC